jgi:hypothetical protein
MAEDRVGEKTFCGNGGVPNDAVVKGCAGVGNSTGAAAVYLKREVSENEDATTRGGASATCGWGSSI